ncbi:MAG: YggS family pyridoxal phosphate-dependent enzyme [Bryobacterales bacterium]|nr:YggS family pyridoxal phosphate-dependent enzyme [Bryobacterales bacterium]
MVTMLRQRLELIEERIGRALSRAGRKRPEITLVAITKVFPAETVREAYGLGLRDFGENYVQEFQSKAPRLADLPGARFHFVGRLQSNKARRAAELFQVIETIDSGKIARKISEAGRSVEAMIEVKLSPEQAKSGVDPEHLAALIEAVRALPNLDLTGLMTMPPWSEDAEQSRPYFRRLRGLAEAHGLRSLSMGMSHDFEVAIEEGATHLRVGTALFGPRQRQ